MSCRSLGVDAIGIVLLWEAMPGRQSEWIDGRVGREFELNEVVDTIYTDRESFGRGC